MVDTFGPRTFRGLGLSSEEIHAFRITQICIIPCASVCASVVTYPVRGFAHTYVSYGEVLELSLIHI